MSVERWSHPDPLSGGASPDAGCLDPRIEGLLDCLTLLLEEDDPSRLATIVVQQLETWIPDAAVAVFRVPAEAGVPTLNAAGHRWRSAERDTPGWLASETSSVAMMVRSMDAIHGRLTLVGPGVSRAVPCAEVLQVPLLAKGKPWGTLNVVRPNAAPLSALQRWLVLRMGAILQDVWRHTTDRATLRALAEDFRVTQERLLERERHQAFGQLASCVALDINNSLTTIVGTTEYLLHGQNLDEPLRSDLALVRSAADDAVAIMASLRSFGSTGHTTDRERVPLDEIAQLCLELAQPALARQVGRIDTSVECLASPWVEVDAEAIRHLLFRLVENAIEALPDGGHIVVTVGETAGEPWVSVSDSGAGIPADDRGRVFEPFFTTKDRTTHRGLGLSECWRIADAHGGAIEITSQPGGGTTVTLRLPPALPVAEVPPVRDDTAHPHALRVLLVDDQCDVRESVSAMLTALGHEVVAVPGGDAALASARAIPFDVVITDLGMPGLNGLDVARGIRTLAPGTPVVLLTGWGLSGWDQATEDVSVVVSKPLTLDGLSDTLARVLQQRPPGAAALVRRPPPALQVP